MIYYKSADEITQMRPSCQLAARVLDFIEDHIKAGVSTNTLNELCHNFIIENKAIPSPLGYRGYPKSVCTSVNQVVCHGIPDDRPLIEGDIINVDVTTYFQGYHGDTSRTFAVGKVSRKARELMQATYESLWVGIKAACPGNHIGDIGAAIKKFIDNKGFSVVLEYTGHGIGKNFHEDPYVCHAAEAGTGDLIQAGMVFTIEPMINAGKRDVLLLDDNWTVETKDQKLSAQFEHTIAIHEDKIEVLTLGENSTEERFPWRKS